MGQQQDRIDRAAAHREQIRRADGVLGGRILAARWAGPDDCGHGTAWECMTESGVVAGHRYAGGWFFYWVRERAWADPLPHRSPDAERDFLARLATVLGEVPAGEPVPTVVG